MIKPSSIQPFDLPSVPLSARRQLPECPAVYFVLDDSQVLYIGKAENLLKRWAGHHKYKQIAKEAKFPAIAWLEVEDPSLLIDIEKALIDYFQPLLNCSLGQPKKGIYKAKLGAYIDRKLKADLEKLAELESRSVSNVIEILIKQAVEKAKTECKI